MVRIDSCLIGSITAEDCQIEATLIIGTTAPLVLIDETLYKLEPRFTSPFLVIRTWMGIWIAVIAIVVVAAEGSVLVKFFSRFMQEIFATIISLIFIVEALNKLHKIFLENPLLPAYCNETISNTSFFDADSNSSFVMDSSNFSAFDDDLSNSTSFIIDSINSPYYSVNKNLSDVPQPNTALLSTILMIGTFYIAYFLRHFRNSKFLGRSARRALGDFGVPIGLFTMVLIDYFIPNTYTEAFKTFFCNRKIFKTLSLPSLKGKEGCIPNSIFFRSQTVEQSTCTVIEIVTFWKSLQRETYHF
ncbi:Anion exchange protein 3 [Araneus ventricosus]|uniref:Anion exchange protein 3 n=1 Tax=Araneus ventricosus TaxID=182803 RepID=A0A4Y2FX33_ARAVE|nr:Anion exchange protein 3 [Araneus ventricosus]